MNNILKNIINPKLKLTEEEKKIEDILIKLLSKDDTDLINEPYNTSILVTNSNLDATIEINGSISIVHDNIFRVVRYRQSFIDHLKELAQKEISNRYKNNKERLFNKSILLLDRMEEKLS